MFNDMVSNPGTVSFKDAMCKRIIMALPFSLHLLQPQIIANPLVLTMRETLFSAFSILNFIATL